uniref:Lipocalin/cytosolic fatty-acid binding domain-containing protein n=1 Tax=Setaria digitata TaxID=48799 RepID=A0A915PCC1_9BILA
MISLFLLSVLVISYVETIGENPIDINTLAGIIGGISNMMQNNVKTIDVPSSQIMGRWYQVYKAAISFDVHRTDMFCPVAYFSPNSVMGEDGFSIEEAFRVIAKNGPFETYKRDLNKVGPGQYWMYTEEYFYPRQFNIINVGPNYTNTTEGKEKEKLYQYMVVTDTNRLSLSVYARHPMTFYQKYNEEVVKFLEQAGFGGKVFWNSPRPIYQGADCEWPSEKEVFARRVLKNQQAAKNSRSEEASKSESFGSSSAVDGRSPITEMLQNPQLALQKLVQGH